MKTSIWILTVSIILIASVVGSIFYFESLATPFQTDPSNDPTNLGNQLAIDNLLALTDGQVSFKVTLNDYESGVIEGVVLNGERYSWSDGSQEDSTIIKNETKQWSIDIGTIEEDDEIQVVVETSTGSVSANAIVGAHTPNGSTTTDPNYVYDYYGGVDLFSEGIHVVATSQDPRTLFGEYNNINDYW